MNQHSLRVLELSKVRDALADRTTSAAGARRARALEPLGDADRIARRLARVTEVRRVLEDSDLPIHGLPDLAETLDAAEPDGAVLPGPRIAPVAKSLHVVARLAACLHERRDTLPGLHELGRGLTPLAELREEVDRAVDPDGEIRDAASPALRRIRRAKDQVRAKVLALLQKVVRSLASGGQEPVVTLRNDRYVIAVRRDRMQGLSGVVHAQSGSGQSVYLEPSAAVGPNNELAELRSAEDEEILRILGELTERLRAELPALRANEETLAALDLAYASGKLSRDLDAIPALPAPDGAVELVRARHPLLVMALAGTGGPVVPLDVALGGAGADVLVITGPNTGGKTVAMKTVGLLCLMHQAGLHVPAAEGTRLPVFRDVFADIGDEQSIEASLSTFSSHMAHVNEMLGGADADTLVLLDELGVGTDPEEGAALGRAILTELARLGAKTIVTTHYGSLKAFAHETPGLENASLEFDRGTLAPTYRFLQGVPGSSEALSIARRLGFPERLVEEARGWIGGEREAVEGLLADLAERRREAERLRAELEAERAEARALQEKAGAKLARLAEERARLRREALEEARRLVERSKAELSEILGAVRADGAGGRAAGRARTRLGEMGKSIERELAGGRNGASGEPARPARADEVREGTPVRIPSMGWNGTALGAPTGNGKVAVSVGSLRVEVPVDSLEIRAATPAERRRATDAAGPAAAVARPEGEVRTELDLRGRTVEEAVDELDRTLDGLVVSGGTWLRVIHGKGTGALRAAVTERLGEDPRVKEFRLGEPGEGGSGVTVVVLR